MSGYTALAKDAPQCFGCGKASDGTLILAHRNRLGFGLLFGRGTKGLSLAGAILCAECHRHYDGAGRKDYDAWEMAVQRTLTWAWRSGFIQFQPAGGEPSQALR